MASSAPQKWFEVLKQLIAGKVFPGTVHRLLLYGPPGTGKSRAVQGERVACHRQMAPEDLLGGWQLANGTTVFVPGPAVRAMQQGSALVLDEVDMVSPDCRSILHALLDDKEMAQLHLPNGQVIKPAPGFCVVGTTNAQPSALPEALLDRFELILHADKPAPGLLDSIGHKGVKNWLRNHYDRLESKAFTIACSARRCLAVDKLLANGVAVELACLAVGFPAETASQFAVAK